MYARPGVTYNSLPSVMINYPTDYVKLHWERFHIPERYHSSGVYWKRQASPEEILAYYSLDFKEVSEKK